MTPSEPSTANQAFYFTSNSLSLLGSLALFFIFFKTNAPSNPPLKLIFLLALSDFLFNLTSLLNPLIGLGDTSCDVIGFFKVFTGWTELFWISLISLYTYIALGDISLTTFAKIFPWLIGACIVIPILIALTPLIGVDNLLYTNVNGYCGVLFAPEATMEQKLVISLTTRILPYLIAVLMTIIACIRAIIFFRRLPPEAIRIYNMNAARLLVYPIAQLIIYTPNALAVFALIWMDGYSEALMIFGMTCYNLCGLINFLVYGRQVYKKQVLYEEEIEAQQSPLYENEHDASNSRDALLQI